MRFLRSLFAPCVLSPHQERRHALRRISHWLGLGVLASAGLTPWRNANAQSAPPAHLSRTLGDTTGTPTNAAVPAIPSQNPSRPLVAQRATAGPSAVSALPQFDQPAVHLERFNAGALPSINPANPYTPAPLPLTSLNTQPFVSSEAVPRFTLIAVQGEVSVNERRAQRGQTLAIGSVVRTGSNGYALYRWLDEMVRVYPNTQVLHGPDPERWIDVQGRVMVSARSASVPRVMHTPMTLLRLNRTVAFITTQMPVYSANAEEVLATYVCVCYGQADLARTHNLRDIVQINGHHHNFPQLVTPRHYQPTATVFEHDDQDVVLLNSLWQTL